MSPQRSERACYIHRWQNAECYFSNLFLVCALCNFCAMFFARMAESPSAMLIFGRDLACELDFLDTGGVIGWHRLSSCLRVVKSYIRRYLSKSGPLLQSAVGRDGLPPFGWCFLSTTNIVVLLHDSFPLNVSILTVHMINWQCYFSNTQPIYTWTTGSCMPSHHLQQLDVPLLVERLLDTCTNSF